MNRARHTQRDYVGAGLLMLASGAFAYVTLGQAGAAAVCAICVGVSLLVSNNI